jgi:hypothetical protein
MRPGLEGLMATLRVPYYTASLLGYVFGYHLNLCHFRE